MESHTLVSETCLCHTGHHCQLVTEYLQDVAPTTALIVASTDHVNAPVNGRHAVPRPLHRPVSARRPTIGRWVEAVGLSEVRTPSAPRGDVHLPIQHRPCVSVNLEGRLKESRRKVNI